MAFLNRSINWIQKRLCPFHRCSKRIEDCASGLQHIGASVADLKTALSDVSCNTKAIAGAAHDASTSATEIMKTIEASTTDINKTLDAAVDCVKKVKHELSAIKTELSGFPGTFRVVYKKTDGTIVSIQYQTKEKKGKICKGIECLVSILVPFVFVTLIVFACLRIGQCHTICRMKENGITVVGVDGSEKVFTWDKEETPKQPVRLIQEK